MQIFLQFTKLRFPQKSNWRQIFLAMNWLLFIENQSWKKKVECNKKCPFVVFDVYLENWWKYELTIVIIFQISHSCNLYIVSYICLTTSNRLSLTKKKNLLAWDSISGRTLSINLWESRFVSDKTTNYFHCTMSHSQHLLVKNSFNNRFEIISRLNINGLRKWLENYLKLVK